MRDRCATPSWRLALGVSFAALALTACGGGGSGGSNSGGGTGGGGGGGGGGSQGMPTDTSSSQSAYITATASGWEVRPLLTVGDMAGTYPMVGKPDGLGILAGRISSTGDISQTDQYFTVLMNHELPDTAGAVHAHGTRGAFISQWTFDLNTLKVVDGRDLVTRIFRYANGAWIDATGQTAFDRLCSANLAPASAFYNSATGNGFNGLIYTNGEEAGTEGRAFAHVLTGADYGTSYELAYLGKLAHETVAVNAGSGDTTLAITIDDASPGQLYAYVGTKGKTGNPAEMAGLVGGKLYGIKVTNGGTNYANGAAPRENHGAIEGTFQLADVSDAAVGPGTTLQTVSSSRGVTEFARPEGGAWDKGNPRVFYFAATGATVDGALQSARLYRLTFDSVEQPTGGTIELVVDSASLTGTDGQTARGFDNVAPDSAGKVAVDEDPGSSDYVSKVWLVDPGAGQATQIFEADRSRFVAGGANFLTVVEEHSGINEATDALRGATWFQSGHRYYIGDLQAHYPLAYPLFEGGQLYLFASP